VSCGYGCNAKLANCAAGGWRRFVMVVAWEPLGVSGRAWGSRLAGVVRFQLSKYVSEELTSLLICGCMALTVLLSSFALRVSGCRW